jgi:GT2 family glycosyltransferase
MSPRILAIIVNWNKRDALERLLQSLPNAGDIAFDVVVVDNASTDESVSLVRDQYPQYALIVNPQNLGGTGGFNSGLRYGLQHPKQYEFFWLLDNDVVIHNGALTGLLAAMQNERTGLVGSTVTLIDDPGHVQEVGCRINWRTAAPERIGEGPISRLERPRLHEVEYVAACSLLARASAVRDIGIWDPLYFLMWDDMDWGIRFNRAGWKVVATTESLVGHESFDKRRSGAPIAMAYLWNRNAYYCMSKFCPPSFLAIMYFHRFRVELSWSQNFESDGYPMEAAALRLAIRDFLAGTMGPAPAELFKRSPAPESSAPLSQAQRAGIRRIALNATENPAQTRAMYAKLQQEFPSARIDTLVYTTREEQLREKFENRILVQQQTLAQRIALLARLVRDYDAVAGASFVPRNYLEKFVRYSIRIQDDLTWNAKERDLFALVRTAFNRARIFATACILTVRALLKPKPLPNYFEF